MVLVDSNLLQVFMLTPHVGFLISQQALTRGYLARSSFIRRKKILQRWQGTSNTCQPIASQSLQPIHHIQDPPKLARQSLPTTHHYVHEHGGQLTFGELSPPAHPFSKQSAQDGFNPTRRQAHDIARKVAKM